VPRVCTVCRSKNRIAIEREVTADREGMRVIAGRYHVGRTALQRHVESGHIREQLETAEKIRRFSGAETITRYLERLLERTEPMLDACEKWLRGPGGEEFDLSPRSSEVLVDVMGESPNGTTVRRERVSAAELLRRAREGAPLRDRVRSAARELRSAVPSGEPVPRVLVDALLDAIEAEDGLGRREEVRLVEAKVADPRKLIHTTADSLRDDVELIARILGVLKPETQAPTFNVQIHVDELRVELGPVMEAFPDARPLVAHALASIARRAIAGAQSEAA
jgi:hypothetical protein